jgi:hypothetical protein
MGFCRSLVVFVSNVCVLRVNSKVVRFDDVNFMN